MPFRGRIGITLLDQGVSLVHRALKGCLNPIEVTVQINLICADAIARTTANNTGLWRREEEMSQAGEALFDLRNHFPATRGYKLVSSLGEAQV
jgi:hypothetical protein